MTVIHCVSSVHILTVFVLVCALAMCGCGQTKPADQAAQPAGDGLHRFIVMDPGHFHASLVFKRAAYKGIAPEVAIYAPVSEDITDHMARVVPFNTRAEDPAGWQYRMYLAPDWSEAVFRERAGDIAVLSGKNDRKLELIKACVDSGFSVLADKPWVIDPANYPMLETILDTAEKKGVVAYDIMTERFEITSILQRLLVAENAVFGSLTEGTPEDPAVVKSSVHHLSKIVAGQPLKRPWWFFDTTVQGEGLVDITTHLVDLCFWILYPDQPINIANDISMVSAKHWATPLTLAQYSSITRHPAFPPQFPLDDKGVYQYFCNGSAVFKLKGSSIKVEVVWNYEAPAGAGDTHYSIIKGTKANVLILQDKEQNYRPELYIQPAPGVSFDELSAALKTFIGSLASGSYPGLSVVDEKAKNRFRIDVPDSYRVGHEAHFGQVTDRFLAYVDGEPMPAWEKANMLAKYYVTTKALEMAR